MDRENLSETIIRELGDMFVTTLTEAGPDLLQGNLDGIERRLQDLSRRVLGQVVEAVVTTLATRAAPEPPLGATCHQPMRLVDRQRLRQLQGLVGDYDLRRPSFVCDRSHQGQVPLDERLGLGAGALAETLRVDVAREAMRRITEGIGQVAEDEEQAAIRRA